MSCMACAGIGAWGSRILPFRTEQSREAKRPKHGIMQRSQQPPWWYQVSLRPCTCILSALKEALSG